MCDLLTQTFRALTGVIGGDTRQDEYKLFSAVAAGDILSTSSLFKQIAERTEEGITRLMAKCVVELLK